MKLSSTTESITDMPSWHEIQNTFFERKFIRKLILFSVLGSNWVFNLQIRITYLVLQQYNEINLYT